MPDSLKFQFPVLLKKWLMWNLNIRLAFFICLFKPYYSELVGNGNVVFEFIPHSEVEINGCA